MKQLKFNTLYRNTIKNVEEYETIQKYEVIEILTKLTNNQLGYKRLNYFIDQAYKMACSNATQREIEHYQKCYRWNLEREVFTREKTFKYLCLEIYSALLEQPVEK